MAEPTYAFNAEAFASTPMAESPPKASTEARAYREAELDESSKFLIVCLLRDSPECRRCYKFKKLVASNPKADEAYLRNKMSAENATPEDRKNYQEMMIVIADAMNKKHGIYTVEGVPKEEMRVMDVCMAPGGFTEAFLRYTGFQATAHAITLDPELDGGLPIVIDDKLITGGLLKLDVTRLFSECTNQTIPEQHANVKQGEVPADWKDFHLVFCDGKPEKFTTEPWTEQSEIERRRLQLSQLILALQRVAVNGTIVMLLHSIEHFKTAQILQTFWSFSKVNVFKPTNAHKKRSSFYMIAKDIRPNSYAAQMALQTWKYEWYLVSFGGPKGTGELPKPNMQMVKTLQAEFGLRLVELGRGPWEIQAKALKYGLPEDYVPDPEDFVRQQPRSLAELAATVEIIPRGTKFGLNNQPSDTDNARRSGARDWRAGGQKGKTNSENQDPTSSYSRSRRGSGSNRNSRRGHGGGGSMDASSGAKSGFPYENTSINKPFGGSLQPRRSNDGGFSSSVAFPPGHLRDPLGPESGEKGFASRSWRDKK